MQVSFRTVGKIDVAGGGKIEQCLIVLNDEEALCLLRALARAGWGKSENLIMEAMQFGDTKLHDDSLKDMEEHDKVFLPVSEASCRYFSPAKYDEQIRIKSSVKELGAAHVDFTYEIFSSESGKKIAEGFTRHPFVNQSWKPVRVPVSIREKLKALV